MKKILTLFTLSACLTFSLQSMDNNTTQYENRAGAEVLVPAQTKKTSNVIPSEITTHFFDNIPAPLIYSVVIPSQLEERTSFKKIHQYSPGSNPNVTCRKSYSQGFSDGTQDSNKHITKNNLVIAKSEEQEFKNRLYKQGFKDAELQQEFNKGLAVLD